MAIIDMTGRRFGRLTVIQQSQHRIKGEVAWDCKCSCGSVKSIRGHSLRRPGGTQSCGCFMIECIRKANTKHGCVGTRTYKVWASIMSRCLKTYHHSYKDYGGRGITICDEWRSFSKFLSDMGEVPNGLTIERKDNSLGYCKDNCRWATLKEQARNRRNNLIVTIDDQSKTAAAWDEEYSLYPGTVGYRVRRGWLSSNLLLPNSRKPRNLSIIREKPQVTS